MPGPEARALPTGVAYGDWFQEAMAEMLRNGGPGWSGIDRHGYVLMSPEELAAKRAAEAARVLESCKAMGLVLCTCTGVDRCEPDGEHKTILDPQCPVHREFFRLERK